MFFCYSTPQRKRIKNKQQKTQNTSGPRVTRPSQAWKSASQASQANSRWQTKNGGSTESWLVQNTLAGDPGAWSAGSTSQRRCESLDHSHSHQKPILNQGKWKSKTCRNTIFHFGGLTLLHKKGLDNKSQGLETGFWVRKAPRITRWEHFFMGSHSWPGKEERANSHKHLFFESLVFHLFFLSKV